MHRSLRRERILGNENQLGNDEMEKRTSCRQQDQRRGLGPLSVAFVIMKAVMHRISITALSGSDVALGACGWGSSLHTRTCARSATRHYVDSSYTCSSAIGWTVRTT
jgi:hypothetical protein